MSFSVGNLRINPGSFSSYLSNRQQFFFVFLTASTTSMILFSAWSILFLLKHRWKGHNTTITLHLLVLHVSPSSFALYLTLAVVEMTFCKCCVCKSNFSTTQPIARMLWSVQCILVAFTDGDLRYTFWIDLPNSLRTLHIENKGCIVTYQQVLVLPLPHLFIPTQAYGKSTRRMIPKGNPLEIILWNQNVFCDSPKHHLTKEKRSSQ